MTTPEPVPTPEPPPPYRRRARLLLAAVLLALFAAMLGYRILMAGELEETALFYVGLPAAIALLVTFEARPRSAVGVALCVTTIGLALAGPLLNEGLVCLLLAAPLFYGVAALIGAAVARSRTSGYSALLLLPLVAITSLEGVGEASLLPRDNTGHAEQAVAASPAEVRSALATPPSYDDPESLFLATVPFPVPVQAIGTGLAVGDARTVQFTPRQSLGIGAEPQEQSMQLTVVERDITATSGQVVFAVTEDSTLARWLDLHTAEVTWQETVNGTRLAWELHYSRTYDPSWYFDPLQRYAMNQAADYLVDTFTPGQGEGPP